VEKNWKERTELLVGKLQSDALASKHVLVVGLGGVGSYAAEALARAGIGTLTIVDGDTVDPTNRNRQLQALSSTHGQSKAHLLADRIRDVNPEVVLNVVDTFQDPAGITELLQAPYSYVVDAIDSISPKVFMLQTAYMRQLKVVSSMGAGGKMDPTLLQVSDISKTDICPFAQYVRKRLRKINIYKGIKAVYSTELPARSSIMHTDGSNFKRSAYGTISYLPAVFGLTCASVVIRDLVEWQPITAMDNMRDSKRSKLNEQE
jgi:tRNA threonylcarbamoyladenosine dehydratase